MNFTCTHDFFFSPLYSFQEKCQVASCIDSEGCCSANYSFFNFYSVAWCFLSGDLYFLGALMAFSFLFFFIGLRFIWNLVEEYLSPACLYLTTSLGISEPVAKATLLGLGNNGAQLAMVLAASGVKRKTSFIFASLLGSGLFICTFVTPLVFFFSNKKVLLEPWALLKDVGMHVAASFLVYSLAVAGQPTWMVCVLMVAFYLIWLLSSFLQTKFDPKSVDSEVPSAKQSFIIESDESSAGSHSFQNGEGILHNPNVGRQLQSFNEFKQLPFEKRLEIKKDRRLRHEEQRDLLYWIDKPFELIKRATMPSCDENDFSRTQCVLFPMTSCFLMAFMLFYSPSTGVYWQWWWCSSIPLGIGITVIFHLLIPIEMGELPRIYPAIQLLGTANALIWAFFVSGIIVDLVSFFSVLSGFSASFLGSIIFPLLIGIPELFVSVSMARKGFGGLALTETFSTMAFGTLAGFALVSFRFFALRVELAWTVRGIGNGEEMLEGLVAVLSGILLVVTGLINKNEMKSFMGYTLGGGFILYFLTAFVVGIVELFFTPKH